MPAAEDDPARCIDRPSAAWRGEVQRGVDATLERLAACTEGLRSSGLVAFGLSFGRNGRAESPRVFRSTVDACPAVDCLKRGLARVGAPPVPTNEEPGFHFVAQLTPDRPPVRIEAPIARGDEKYCADPYDVPRDRIPPEQIQERVRANYAPIRTCYELALKRDPTLRGDATIRFVIGGDGRVVTANVVKNSVPDCSVAECARETIRATTFPKPGSATVTIVYPLAFEPK